MISVRRVHLSPPDAVHIKERPRDWTSHTACDRGIVPCQPCLFQISQLFHASPFIDSQVSVRRTYTTFSPLCKIRENLHEAIGHLWEISRKLCLWKQVHRSWSFSKKRLRKRVTLGLGVYVLTPFFICQTWGTDMEPGTFWQHPLRLAGNDVIIRGDQ